MPDDVTLLIDSHALGYQACFAKGNIDKTLDDGEAIGVVLGFLDWILYLGSKFRTNSFEFCWDCSHETSLRRRRYDFYKAQRQEVDEETKKTKRAAKIQFRQLRDVILPKLGFANQHIAPGYEADDLIAKIVQSRLGRYVVVTSDADMYQVLYGAKFYNPFTDMLVTSASLLRDKGVSYDQWCLVKQIGGCKSDNVPGVPGVGEATAISFLRKELPVHTKKYKAIVSDEGLDIIERNRWLVEIPLRSTPLPEHKPDTFSYMKFRNTCLELGLDAPLEQRTRWERFFAGDFEYED